MKDIIDFFKQIYVEAKLPSGFSETYERIISAPRDPKQNLETYDDIFDLLSKDKDVGTRLSRLEPGDRNDFLLELFKAEGYLQKNEYHEGNKRKRENVFTHSVDIENIKIQDWAFVEQYPLVLGMLEKKSELCEKNTDMSTAIKSIEKLIEIYKLCNDPAKRDYELAYKHLDAYNLYKKNNDRDSAKDHIRAAQKLAEDLKTNHLADYEKKCLLINVYSSIANLTRDLKDERGQKDNKASLMMMIYHGNKLIGDETVLDQFMGRPPKIYVNAILSYNFALSLGYPDLDRTTLNDLKTQRKNVKDLARKLGIRLPARS